eukprot:gene984-1923_t
MKGSVQQKGAVEAAYYEKLEGGQKESKESEKRGLTFFELMRVLKPYFWPSAGTDGALLNRLRTTSTWLLVGLSKAANLYAPLFISVATNKLISHDLRGTFLNVIIYCALRLLSSIFKELQGIVYLKVKQQASIQLSEQTFTHLHSLSLNWHLSKKMGNVIRAMDRGADAANDLVTYMFLYFGPAIGECVAACLIFYFHFENWLLSVVVFSGVILYSLATAILAQWRTRVREQANKHDNKYHEKAADSMVNFETVKYFTAEAYEVARFKYSVAEFQRLNVTTQASLGILNITQQTILNTTLAGGLILSGVAVVDGRMDIGDFVAVNAYIASMFVPLSYLGTVYSSIIKGLVDVTNLSQLLSESPDVVDVPNAKPLVVRGKADNKLLNLTCGNCSSKVSIGWKFCPQCRAGVTPRQNGLSSEGEGLSVEFKNIFFHYPEQLPRKGLKNVSFKVPAGTTTAIVGHTGAGKTTISRLLFRFYDPLQGLVEIGGQDIKKCTQRSVRGAIGIVPQDTVLFNDTILHNVQYGRLNATMEEVEAAAEAAQIKTFIESLPDGWQTMVGERGLKLSGGEKQRVAIARCLLKDPPVVLLDEATSALDTQTEHSVQEALAVLGQHRTVIIIAHRLSTIRNADQIIVMDDGDVSEKGTHDELLQRKGGYWKLWQMQARHPVDTDMTDMDGMNVDVAATQPSPQNSEIHIL